MKVLFLDVDGVLNAWGGEASFAQLQRARAACPEISNEALDPVLVQRLVGLIEATGAKIVLSSTWRDPHWRDGTKDNLEWLLRYTLAQHGVGILDRTPRCSRTRGEEIADWLGAHSGEVERYCILDDDSDMLPEQRPFFVHTDTRKGLSEANVAEAKRVLGVEALAPLQPNGCDFALDAIITVLSDMVRRGDADAISNFLDAFPVKGQPAVYLAGVLSGSCGPRGIEPARRRFFAQATAELERQGLSTSLLEGLEPRKASQSCAQAAPEVGA